MIAFADLELSIHRRDGKSYSIEGRLTLPGSETDTRFGLDKPISMELDLVDFDGLINLPPDYGKLLAERVFGSEEMRKQWANCKAQAQAVNAPLRFQLLIGATASELNGLYWETLTDYETGQPLFTGENLLFSRYLSASDMRPVRLRPKGSLRALAVAANPSNLSDYKLAAVDVAGELARAKEALGDIPVTNLPGKDGDRVTLNRLIEELRNGYDILYLAAHGTLASGQPFMWLEMDDGKVDRIQAIDLAIRIQELANQPRLIVLASCQSAGNGNGDSLQAIGPRLAQAGIPAVMAMQGNISMDSVKKFMPVFFAELQKDGQIDRALSVARGTIRTAPDFWMPVLFMRLQSGKIWYVPGVGNEGDEFDKWQGLLTSIKNGQCTPILGPGIYEPMVGPLEEIAVGLSSEYGFPLAPFFRDSLPLVSQYILINQDFNTLLNEMDEVMRTPLRRRFEGKLPANVLDPGTPLADLFGQAGALFRQQDQYEQNKVLASLPLKIYITTNYDNMLSDALREAGKDPQIETAIWSEVRFDPLPETIFDRDPSYVPTAQKPLVYHLFGNLDNPDTMVLTEDDYFEFLLGFTMAKKRNPPLIPTVVSRAMTDSALMFLGFQLDDWYFRALFRTLMGQSAGGGRRARYMHVGVQVEPDETNNISPKRARRYMEKYFGAVNINLYWGKSEDFLRELAQRKLS